MTYYLILVSGIKYGPFTKLDVIKNNKLFHINGTIIEEITNSRKLY